MKRLWGLTFLLVYGSAAMAAERSSFLSQGPGAAARAMGEAFTALADDPSALYYNPAGLSRQPGAFYGEYTPITSGRTHFAAAQYPTSWGTVGLGVYQMAVSGIEGRQSVGDTASAFSATQSAFFLPFSRHWDHLSLGGSLKAVDYRLGSYSDTGWGADAGVLYTSSLQPWRMFKSPEWSAGLSLKNVIQPSLTLVQEKEVISREGRLGLALSSRLRPTTNRYNLEKTYDRTTLSLDVPLGPSDGSKPGVGLAYHFRELMVVRGGFGHGFSMGFGISGQRLPLALDYAASFADTALDHHVALSWKFVTPTAARETSPARQEVRQATLSVKEALRNDLVKKGRQQFSKQSYAAAQESFQKALLLSPDDASALRGLQAAEKASRETAVSQALADGRSALSQGRQAEAFQAAASGAEADPLNRQMVRLMAGIKKRSLQSPDSWRRFLDLQREFLDTALARQREALSSGDVIKGSRWLDVARTVVQDAAPEMREKLNLLALSQDRLFEEEMTNAEKNKANQNPLGVWTAYRRAAKIHPEDRLVKARLKEWSDAYHAERRFTPADLMNQEALYERASLAYVQGQVPEALKILDDLLKDNALHPHGIVFLEYLVVQGIVTP